MTDGFTIEAGEQRTIEAGEFRVPETAPPTLGKTQVWVYTGLDIDWSVDPNDEDHLAVEPGPYYAALLEAVENLGFSRRSVDNVKASSVGPHSFVQELEYRPTGGRYASALDEIELFPYRSGDALEVVVEVDQRGSSLFGRDESHHRLTVDSTDAERVERQVGDLIDDQL